MSGGYLLWLAASMAAFLAASSALRRYVDTHQVPVLIGALALYTLGNLIMVRLMRESGMAIAISVSAVAQLLAANAVAVVVFGERPGGLQLAGIALGAAAMALILLPGQRG